MAPGVVALLSQAQQARTGAYVAGPNHTQRHLQAFKTNRIVIGVGALAAIVLALTYYTGSGFPGMRPSGVTVEGAPCAEPGASAAVRAYTLALTNPATLRVFVQDHAASFAADGDASECYAALAAALGANRELSLVDAMSDRADAERETGLDFNRAAYAADLAETLRELAESLPSLARADDGPYTKTKAYESALAYSTLVRRTPRAAAGIDALIQADADVLHELAALTNRSR